MKRLTKDQHGLAAILVSVFIMLVLTLVVLAFSQITRREQRQGLDRQLVTQAFVAAESGISQATEFIRTNKASDPGGVLLERKNCNTDPPDKLKSVNAKLDGSLPGSSSVFKYSCVLFDRHPLELQYSNINTENGEILSLKTESGDLSNLTITWKAAGGGGSNYSGCPSIADVGNFPKQGDYPGNCDAGMIRVLLMPFSSGADLNREKLTNASYTVYLRPVKAGSDPIVFTRHDGGPDGQGQVLAAKCDSPAGNPAAGQCTATIQGLGVVAGQGLFMHIRSIYKDSLVTISGTNGGGTPVRFTEAQAVIDSTGKANDVLKRLQVRIPLVEHYDLPAFVVETINGICKQLDVHPTNATASSACGGNNYFN